MLDGAIAPALIINVGAKIKHMTKLINKYSGLNIRFLSIRPRDYTPYDEVYAEEVEDAARKGNLEIVRG